MDITGPHDSAADDDKWWDMVARLPNASERLDKMVEYSCRILARTRPIHAIIRGAADNEAFAADLRRRLLAERLANQTERIGRQLGDTLRSGLSVVEAGQRYCALTSPELYHLLTVELAWTAEQHQHWVYQLLHTELLGTDDVFGCCGDVGVRSSTKESEATPFGATRFSPRVTLGTDKGVGMAKNGSQSSKSPSELIDERIDELGDWRGETLAQLRALVHEADPDVVEEWKWRGVPTWEHDGMICTGETYKNYVKVTFAKGASLDDPAGLFNSSLEGNTRRAIDFHEGETINTKAFKALINAAVALNESKVKR